MDNKEKITEIVEQLNRFSHHYYVLDNPQISDKDYDILYDQLVSLEKQTGYVLPYSPTLRIGDGVLSQFQKYTHKAKLWSLDKAQSIGEFREWDLRIRRAISEYNESNEEKLPSPTYVITKKFDGLSINLTYDEEGLLSKAATRGTGVIGEAITAQVKTIKAIPLKIDNRQLLEVHGEAIMTKGAFQEYNNTAQTPLKNLRNGAAGALRNLNIKETAKRKLSAFFYDVGYNEGEGFVSYREMLEFIKNMELPIDDYAKYCTSIEQVEKEFEFLESIREDLEYEIDGAVVVIDDIKTRDVLGYTIKFPKWAIAYKFEAEETTTKLLSVEWNVGRSGRVSPTALLEPVELAGVTVRRATLNNMEDIKKKAVRVGAEVFIRRSNDVIPEIMGVVEETLVGTTEIIPPTECPFCGSELILDGAHYFCENTLSCKPQMVKSIVHFGSREAMNIEGFSGKTAEQLFEKLNLKSLADLYRLNKEELLTLEKFSDKKSDNLLNAIEKSKNCDLSSFIFALGIPNVGKKTAKDLVKRFKNLETIQKATQEELIEVQDIGEIVAKSVMEFFKQDKIVSSIQELLELGVTPFYEEEKQKESFFTGKTVVVTGSLKGFSRTEIKDKLESRGAKVSGSVSKNTDFVIAGNDPGSKYDKALTLEIRVVREDELVEMLND